MIVYKLIVEKDLLGHYSSNQIIGIFDSYSATYESAYEINCNRPTEYTCLLRIEKYEIEIPNEPIMNKSLLKLLKEEDELSDKTRRKRKWCNSQLKDYGYSSEKSFLKDIKDLKDSEKALLECRKEISKYLDYLKTLVEN